MQPNTTFLAALLDMAAPARHVGTEAISTCVSSNVGAAVLGCLVSLRQIAMRSTGYDRIDLDYCRAAGSASTNAPD